MEDMLGLVATVIAFLTIIHEIKFNEWFMSLSHARFPDRNFFWMIWIDDYDLISVHVFSSYRKDRIYLINGTLTVRETERED